jgi:hypothetical protein
MNREAAALGVPVYSIFRGTIGAVDRYLEKHGRLVLLESVADVRSKMQVIKRTRAESFAASGQKALTTIVKLIAGILGDTATTSNRSKKAA